MWQGRRRRGEEGGEGEGEGRQEEKRDEEFPPPSLSLLLSSLTSPPTSEGMHPSIAV
jgi:hypothetical protein